MGCQTRSYPVPNLFNKFVITLKWSSAASFGTTQPDQNLTFSTTSLSTTLFPKSILASGNQHQKKESSSGYCRNQWIARMFKMQRHSCIHLLTFKYALKAVNSSLPHVMFNRPPEPLKSCKYWDCISCLLSSCQEYLPELQLWGQQLNNEYQQPHQTTHAFLNNDGISYWENKRYK